MRAPVGLALAAVVALCGCSRLRGERGNGRIEQQERQVDPFAEVEVSGAMQVHVVPGAQRVVVRADANLLPRLMTEVHDGRLRIRMEGATRPTVAPEVELRTPWLRTIEAHGASTVTAARVTGDAMEQEVTLSASGASKVTVGGSCDRVTASASGASLVDANDLIAQEARADASGASTVRVFAARAVSTHASGASTVRVAGHPISVQRDGSGASSILVE